MLTGIGVSLEKKGQIKKNTYQKIASLQDSIRKNYENNIDEERELATPYHSRRADERKQAQLIISGDVEACDRQIDEANLNGCDMIAGDMADTEKTQATYLVVSAVTLSTRAAIDNGLPEEIAYNISDSYLHALEKLDNPSDINMLSLTSQREFALAMRNWKQKSCSLPIKKCLGYISAHLHDKISLQELSDISGLKANYISDLFQKELNMRPVSYIRQLKLKRAKSLLTDSDMDISAIAFSLGFASPSSFSAYFKKEFGLSPLKYRNN